MIDSDGFRPNVGIILVNSLGQVLWARRLGQSGWQFPQGGIKAGESPEQAMYRELAEEVGLRPHDVEIVAVTRNWLKYRLPKRMIRRNSHPVCVGQKQKWFLLRLVSPDEAITIDHTDSPEFDAWCWVSYWYPLSQVVAFKKDVYRKALRELSPKLSRMLKLATREK
ncbi:MAG: RNA pyrophosphohydrolase [Pontibacterium sp.]